MFKLFSLLLLLIQLNAQWLNSWATLWGISWFNTHCLSLQLSNKLCLCHFTWICNNRIFSQRHKLLHLWFSQFLRIISFHQFQSMASLLFNCFMKILVFDLLRFLFSRRSLSMSCWLCSVFELRSVVGIKSVSDCLRILRKSVSGRENRLRNILLVVIHIFMEILFVDILVVLSSKQCVVVTVSSRGHIVKIWVDIWISALYTRLPSIRINISIWVIDDSLSFWIAFVCVNVTPPLSLSVKRIWGW